MTSRHSWIFPLGLLEPYNLLYHGSESSVKLASLFIQISTKIDRNVRQHRACAVVLFCVIIRERCSRAGVFLFKKYDRQIHR